MTGRDSNGDANIIREIVEADERRALDRFRSNRFAERLKKSLADPAARTLRPEGFRPALRPVWGSLAILIVMAAAAVWLLRPRTRAITGGAVVEAFLHGLPGLQAIENPPRPLSAVSPGPGSLFEKNIAAVLSGPPGSSASPGSSRSRELSAVKPGSQPLGLERVYEILIIDKSVERVLTDLSPKTKEG
ncbi:MAG: hypothetical protein A2W03_06755 [Candidatus Aminicenantes bacterium RBG_16_63_16]|nr:MAG: hypothetical protein A2W03_06755 [Candidatus Aminicenantes bacterium RBG_16_63_16]